MSQKNSGFTITEVMVTIAIIAITASIAIPNLIGWLPKYRLGSAARDVMSMIEQTRMTAVQQYANATIQFNTGDSSYTATVGGQVFEGGRMPAGVTITSVTFTGADVSFDRQGLADEGGNIILSSEAGDKTINIKISGNVKIQ